jgi:hypothetical protein
MSPMAIREWWNRLFGPKNQEATLNINVNIAVKDLDKIVGVLSKLSPNRVIIEEVNQNRQINNKDTPNAPDDLQIQKKSQKAHLKEDPITAKDVAEIFSAGGIKKGIDKTGSEVFSQSEGSSTDNQVSSLKRFKKEEKQNG